MNYHDIKVGIHTHAEQLAAIDFLPHSTNTKSADNATASQIADQLAAYFNNGTFQFNLSLYMQGTEFQKRVWQALLNIRAGETFSYGAIADELHSSARAVGNACRANPIPIVVPCHRVVAKHGIGGYCGQTGGQRLRIKQWLLRHERG
ncbi:MAG: hypothetical protein AMJ53_12895 [Gammaproteobacteria bacterium SG8_11]|nr:MAG: hypothetical protein AMJ53_12895 [Gammaproteobacteria bacterium SG8_11]